MTNFVIENIGAVRRAKEKRRMFLKGVGSVIRSAVLLDTYLHEMVRRYLPCAQRDEYMVCFTQYHYSRVFEPQVDGCVVSEVEHHVVCIKQVTLCFTSGRAGRVVASSTTIRELYCDSVIRHTARHNTTCFGKSESHKLTTSRQINKYANNTYNT